MRLNFFLSSLRKISLHVYAGRSLSRLRMASTLPSTPIFDAIAKHDPRSLAIVHSASDRSFCYGSLLHDVAAAKDNLSSLSNGKPLRGERIAFLAENGYDYVGADR
jgi:malonyl-CoA/methylmalonyl-CoA synthetase